MNRKKMGKKMTKETKGKTLDSKLEELKKYQGNKDIERLNKKIFNLDLSKEFLSSLSQDKLQYIHVKLHNALSYKKPFSKVENIKKVHNGVARLLKNHLKIDKVDE